MKPRYRHLSLKAGIAAFTTIVLLDATAPAQAMTGSEAVRACEQKPGCTWREGSGNDIWINVGGKLIFCPGLRGTCAVIGRNGTKIKRAVLGQFTTGIGSSGADGNGSGQGGNGGVLSGGGSGGNGGVKSGGGGGVVVNVK